MNEYSHQILDLFWSKGQSAEQGSGPNKLRPKCRVWELSAQSTSQSETEITLTNTAEFDLTAPYTFNWRLSDKFFCPGYDDATGNWHPCPNQNEIETKFDRCGSCERLDGFKSAFFMGAAPNERMKQHLAKQQHIYLAYFWPHTVKVGTAVEGREEIRLIEQDALYAVLVASATGHEIGKLERDIARQLGLTTSVRGRQKLAGLKQKINSEAAHANLTQLVSKLQHSPNQEISTHLLNPEEIRFIDHTANPFVYFPEVETNIIKIDKPQVLTGTYLGLRGKNLFVENQGKTYQISTDHLINRHFAHSDEKLEYALVDRQQSLF
jgi:hypothetical protein